MGDNKLNLGAGVTVFDLSGEYHQQLNSEMFKSEESNQYVGKVIPGTFIMAPEVQVEGNSYSREGSIKMGLAGKIALSLGIDINAHVYFNNQPNLSKYEKTLKKAFESNQTAKKQLLIIKI